MPAGSFSLRRLRMPWSAKKKSKETKTPEVSANLCCAISLTHSCIQTFDSPATIVLATTSAENYMEPIPYEVS